MLVFRGILGTYLIDCPFLGFAFLKLSKLEIIFQRQDSYIWIKGKDRPGNPNMLHG